MRLELPAAIAATKVVAVMRNPPLGIRPAVEAVAAGGVLAVEVTLNTPGALEAIADLVDRKPAPEMLVGAGTVLDVEDAQKAVAAGAELVVTPVASTEVVRWCVEAGVPVIPGAHTATEIHSVWRAGATAVKVYPYVTGGADHIRALRGPLPDVRYLAFGGVTVDDVPDVLSAGGLGVGMGGWLTDDPDVSEVTRKARLVLDAAAR